MRNIIIAAVAATTLSGCATLDAAGDRWLSSDTSLVETALLVDTVRNLNPDLGNFETRLAAYAAIDCLKIADEAARHDCTIEAIRLVAGD